MTSQDTNRPYDSLFGGFDEHPHAEIDLSFGEWNEGAQRALELELGPPIAWEFDEGTLHLWGEQLDDEMLDQISEACREVASGHSDVGIPEAARNARNTAPKIAQADITNDEGD